MTLLLKEDDVRILLDMPTAIEAVEESFRRQAAGEAQLKPRRRLELPGRIFLNDMAAADSKGGWMGAKLYSVAHGAATFVFLLFRAENGELAAILEADLLGQMRTGAASGVATKYLSRPDSRIVGLIGTGLQARWQLAAVSEVRKVDEVRAYGRDSVRRADFCREMSQLLGVPVTAASSAEDAVRGADIVITATNSVKPVLSGAWLSPGTHVNAMGANLAVRRELDSDVVTRSAVVAVDAIEQARTESGDLIEVFGGEDAKWSKACELCQIVAGNLPGRTQREEITLFKSNGIATWDLAVAAKMFELAQHVSVGQEIPIGK